MKKLPEGSYPETTEIDLNVRWCSPDVIRMTLANSTQKSRYLEHCEWSSFGLANAPLLLASYKPEITSGVPSPVLCQVAPCGIRARNRERHDGEGKGWAEVEEEEGRGQGCKSGRQKRNSITNYVMVDVLLNLQRFTVTIFASVHNILQENWNWYTSFNHTTDS